jgi:group I intron endonuclease
MKWISASTRLPLSYAVPGIYAIRHHGNGKMYIGSSVDCRSRLWQHLRDLRRCTHFAPKLRRSWNKYGEHMFQVCIIEEVPRKTRLITREQYWIDRNKSYSNGFNTRPRAEANYDMKWTAGQNARRRASNINRWAETDLRDQLSERFKGRRRGKWTSQSHIKASQSLKKMHRIHPEWRKATIAVFAKPEVQAKRLSHMRDALKRPDVYARRVKQLRNASASPKRIHQLRQVVVRRRNLPSLGIRSSAALDMFLRAEYTRGKSLRQISKVIGMDHKSIAARLRQCGVRVEQRYASGTRRPHKLNEAAITDILRRLSHGESQSAIAIRYQVSSSVVSEINTGKAWKHIPRTSACNTTARKPRRG